MPATEAGGAAPPFVIFEGVDGAGKTTLARALGAYYTQHVRAPGHYYDSLPGSLPGTLGEWVYRVHHGTATDGPQPEAVAPAALQLLHVAAHVDTIVNRLGPALRAGWTAILDRYWWSTYAYARMQVDVDHVWAIVNASRAFWADLSPPVVVYVTRDVSLKADEITPTAHAELAGYYAEIVAFEQAQGVRVIELANNDTLADAWRRLLAELRLPYHGLPDVPAPAQ